MALPVFTDADGTIMPITEPRVARLMRWLARKQGRIARVRFGAVEAHLGGRAQPLTIKLTEAESER